MTTTADVVDPLLFVQTTIHRDLEQQRIANAHRLAVLTRTTPDEDGVMRGFALDERHPDVVRLAALVDALAALEHDAELSIKRALRRSPLHPWIKAQPGLGEKQTARLLGAIGDPYWHAAEDRPRTISELWAYCGLHTVLVGHGGSDALRRTAGEDQTPEDHTRPGTRCVLVPGERHRDPDPAVLEVRVAARRTKGQRANWSTDAKTRAYLCATSCIKQHASPYRATYLGRRHHTAVAHADWTAGHSHADGIRITSKAILRDLWREARRLHHLNERDDG
ncbi:hypothetical protein GCM10023340_08340 [Nocardioides marinquilinus]|uniref:Uncharacterized protein n=1 Tax=Nocardioides marinquilinus TaxID=1210400 RepID=A0ABP9PA37_9ACTN